MHVEEVPEFLNIAKELLGGCQGMGYAEVYTARINQLSGAQLRRILLQLYTGQKAADVL